MNGKNNTKIETNCNDEFELVYQPQLDMQSGHIVCVEALLRWNHPERGLLSPCAFIPVAEECGLIVAIGQWVMRAACEQARRLHLAHFSHVRVSINVSARQLNDRHFVTSCQSVMRETGVAPEQLVLEVTESTLMLDINAALASLHELRRSGVTLAIDDFGTGYSSLSYLKQLPVTILKVDRSFVQHLPHDEDDRAITTLIVAMANSLQYRVVVEGVETESQWIFLRDCGCHYGQGYYFSRPVPAPDLMALLRDNE
ncbi:putative bifunctional diguanylate cyclase/phosphodiesterase [Marinimicrobium sp. ARAG 43.8]|uniref:putative bifunctional diguanylate cyclase/phosphodiesterase n=1 Tax=Marinimicrobium sp. ARAG 43.8 TaxID=3418719 RepID=UPI003CF5947A